MKNNVTIASAGVTLKNAVIDGNLNITEGVGTGEVTLDNIEVKGETIVSGGGMNSIVFINTKIGRLKVDVPDGTPVRIVASGDSSINMTAVNSESKFQDEQVTGSGFKEIVISVPELAKVTLDGNFDSVTLDSPNAKLDVLGGAIGNITVAESAKNSDLKLASTVTVSDLTANTEVTIGGTGKIDNATITSSGVTIAQKPSNISVSQGVTSKVNNNTVNSSTNGSSDTTNNTNNSGGSGGSSGDFGDGGGNPSKELTYQYVEVVQNSSATVVRMVFDEQVAFYANNALVSGPDIASAFVYQGENINGSVSTTLVNGGKTVEFHISKVLEPGSYQIRFNQTLTAQNWELKGTNSNAKFDNLNNIVVPFKVNDQQKHSFTLTGPENVTVFAGETATFSVTTDSSLKPEYQWYRDGAAIAGATNASYTFTADRKDNGAQFFVKAWIVSDDAIRETAESAIAVLTVKEKTDSGDDGKAEEDLTQLSSLSIEGKGIDQNFNFTGYVPSVIEVESKPTTDKIELQVGTLSSDAEVVVLTKNNPNDSGKVVSPASTNKYSIACDANMQYKKIVITVSLKSDPAKQSQYTIEVINNSPLIVTDPGFMSESDHVQVVDGTKIVTYCIRYLKPSESFTGLEYSVNGGSKIKMSVDNKDFIQETLENGIIQVRITKKFISSLKENDEITFYFTFAGGQMRKKHLN